MNAGLPSEACKDFCGGINMTYELRDGHVSGHDDKLWLTLERATHSHAMICCGTAWKGVRAYKGGSAAKKKTLTFLCCMEGRVAEHCVTHWTGGRTCLRYYRSHHGNHYKSFIIYWVPGPLMWEM